MTDGNMLDDGGPYWHLYITDKVTAYKMLDKAAWNVQQRGKSGIVHRHGANRVCNNECEVVGPKSMEEHDE